MSGRARTFSLAALGLCAAGLAAWALWPRPGIRQRIADLAARECQPKAVCLIDLDRVADPGWERFFAFRAGTHRTDIERAAGVRLPHHDTAFATAFFVRAGMVVEEEVDLEIERPNIAIFGVVPDFGYLVVDHARPKVRIEREDDGVRHVYRVEPADAAPR